MLIDQLIEEQEGLLASEKLAGNIVKAEFHKGALFALRLIKIGESITDTDSPKLPPKKRQRQQRIIEREPPATIKEENLRWVKTATGLYAKYLKQYGRLKSARKDKFLGSTQALIEAFNRRQTPVLGKSRDDQRAMRIWYDNIAMSRIVSSQLYEGARRLGAAEAQTDEGGACKNT